MPFDWNAHLRETAQHLCRLADTPGWRKYAEQRRQELLDDPTWEGLREEIQRVRAEQRTAADAATTGETT